MPQTSCTHAATRVCSARGRLLGEAAARKAKSGSLELLDAAAFYTFAFAVCFRHSPSTRLSYISSLRAALALSARQYGEGVCCSPKLYDILHIIAVPDVDAQNLKTAL